MNVYAEIKKVLRELGGDISFTLSVPEDKAHGDIATNSAFALSKKEGKSPKEVAEYLKPLLLEKISSVVSHIEVASPGFINFFIKPEAIRSASQTVGKIETKFTGKKVLVEHSSLNLFKPFTIGHLVNNFIGEFVSRVVKVGGAHLTTMSFPSDVSLGIAKALFIIQEDGGKSALEMHESAVVQYLGEAYRRGVIRYDEDESVHTRVREIATIMYTHTQGEIYDIYSFAKRENIAYFLKVLKSVGSTFNDTVYESEAGEKGLVILLENTGENKVFTRSEGAIVYMPHESRKDINTSVFVNSEGHPTYEAKDIGLIDIKFTRHNPDASFFITDAEQIQHFKVVLDACSKLGGEWPSRVERSIHVPHGRMLFKGQKMSSRLGGVPLALDVIGAVEEEVRERASDKLANHSQEERDEITRSVALSALRIAVLRSKPGLNINFDPETSLSFEGDSGPYLLYTHARCSSLLEKGKEIMPAFVEGCDLTTLERTLLHFNEVLKESVEDIAPQKLVTYLFKVAQELNSFYGREQIVSDDAVKTAHNLAIIAWTKEVLKQGLFVLGIEAVERM
jgi:arginyl-tRNA synthetase